MVRSGRSEAEERALPPAAAGRTAPPTADSAPDFFWVPAPDGNGPGFAITKYEIDLLIKYSGQSRENVLWTVGNDHYLALLDGDVRLMRLDSRAGPEDGSTNRPRPRRFRGHHRRPPV
jgi:hypothetical protein